MHSVVKAQAHLECISKDESLGRCAYQPFHRLLTCVHEYTNDALTGQIFSGLSYDKESEA